MASFYMPIAETTLAGTATRDRESERKLIFSATNEAPAAPPLEEGVVPPLQLSKVRVEQLNKYIKRLSRNARVDTEDMLNITMCWAFADDLYMVEIQELPGHFLDDKDGYLYVATFSEAVIGHHLVTFTVVVTAERDWHQTKASAADITVTVQRVTALSSQELTAAVAAGTTVATIVVASEQSSEDGSTTTDDDDASTYVYSDDEDEDADLESSSGDASIESTEAAASGTASAVKRELHRGDLDADADAEEAPAKKQKCD
eukprot:16052-Heterococcus_DN1.PRE.8